MGPCLSPTPLRPGTGRRPGAWGHTQVWLLGASSQARPAQGGLALRTGVARLLLQLREAGEDGGATCPGWLHPQGTLRPAWASQQGCVRGDLEPAEMVTGAPDGGAHSAKCFTSGYMPRGL